MASLLVVLLLRQLVYYSCPTNTKENSWNLLRFAYWISVTCNRNHGIFRLTTPGGMSVIRQCQQRGFHPHNQPPDGGPIYDTCTDVYMNPDLKFDVIDLRWEGLYHPCMFIILVKSWTFYDCYIRIN